MQLHWWAKIKSFTLCFICNYRLVPHPHTKSLSTSLNEFEDCDDENRMIRAKTSRAIQIKRSDIPWRQTKVYVGSREPAWFVRFRLRQVNKSDPVKAVSVPYVHRIRVHVRLLKEQLTIARALRIWLTSDAVCDDRAADASESQRFPI